MEVKRKNSACHKKKKSLIRKNVFDSMHIMKTCIYS